MSYTRDEIALIVDRYGDGAFTYQQRRHPDVTENYILYRDKNLTNRITNRQSVNIPLMKYVIRTALKEIDDPMDIYFRNRDNDKQKEIFFNELWQAVKKDQKIDVRDIVDKKQVMQAGRSTTQWNIVDGKITFELDDFFDIFFDQFTDPTDIDGTCNYMAHRHIFKTLESLNQNKMYNKVALNELRLFYQSAMGVVKAGENAQSLQEKNQRAQEMGFGEVNTPEVGDIFVEMTHHWVRLYDDELEEMCIYFIVTAEGKVLYFGKQEDVIGPTKDNYWRNHFIKTSWADDVERNDIYSDGLADMIRPINKVVNAWFSQDVENRTLRNYGMNYYNSSIENFFPQTFDAVPWGWYPIPVPTNMKISDVVSNIQIQPLQDTLPAIQFAIGIAEKAAATSSTSAGQVNEKKVTLGEVELVLQESKDRLKTMSNYYVPAWEERATKFIKLIEAASDKIDAVQLFKKGYRGNVFTKTTTPADWMTENGYVVEITSKADVKNRTIEMINTLNAVRASMPDNIPLLDIYERKMLDMVDGLTPDEIKSVMDYQKNLRDSVLQNGANPQITPSVGAGAMPNRQLQITPGMSSLPAMGA